MSDVDSRAFFGAVLKAIACTRNHNADETGYAEGVLAPATRIREFEKEVGERGLTPAEIEQVLGWLDSTFRTKQTPAEEREYYLGKIAEVSGLARLPENVGV
ncbi:hypothetical protein [Micromonospora cathayae]|uniref:Uncharacterized protein n=1 Tax=Micromonospora cathayae TaxID=3028804 RepID=A0ABY7ZNT8_9ACTN|nr:hypothetical protein [Micromonospora sp. HUAS 3]WDZ83559.1 hypothetical protein PVK37_24300 [Micromonospora sp. HUAS 3]